MKELTAFVLITAAATTGCMIAKVGEKLASKAINKLGRSKINPCNVIKIKDDADNLDTSEEQL